MRRESKPQAPLIITGIFSIQTFAIGAVIGFAADMDNFQTAKIFRLSILAALFVSWGVYLAARLSPKYAYLWLLVIAAPIPFAFRIGQAPSTASLLQTLVVAAAPTTLGLLIAGYFRRKHRRETNKG